MLDNSSRAVYVEVAEEAVDKIQIGLDKMLGVKVQGHHEIQAFQGLRHAYVQITGDSEVFGRLPAYKMRSQEAIIAADFPKLLANSLTKRVVQDYRETSFREDRLISFIGSASSLKPQSAVRVGYFGDLDVVDPEAADYVEAAKPGEEGVEFEIATRGNILTVTRRVIMSDDQNGITRRVNGWGRAARRTLARYLWGFYLNNATYGGDSTAWFAAGHGNLITDVMSPAKIAEVISTLMDMAEPDSGEKLGLDEARGLNLTLVVGHALFWAARTANRREYLDAAFTPNPVYQMFGANNERIVVLPLETDADNWGVLCDPKDRNILEVRFLNGQTDPEIFVSNNLGAGQMLRADKVQFKVRHEYGADLLDFRNGVKSVVP
jgi:hypothetical protein